MLWPGNLRPIDCMRKACVAFTIFTCFISINILLLTDLSYRAYDMDLNEDEAMKLASLGNDTGSREGNHLLIKSLDTHKR